MTTKTIYSLLLALATTVVIAQNNEVKSLEQVLATQNQSSNKNQQGPNINAQNNASSNANFNQGNANNSNIPTVELTSLLTENLGSIYFLANQVNYYGDTYVRLYTDAASFQNIPSLTQVADVSLLVITINSPSELQSINLNSGHINNLTGLQYIYLDIRYQINNVNVLKNKININNPNITVFYNIVIPQ